MNPNFILLDGSDSIGCLFVAIGIVAAIAYIKTTIDDIKATQRKKSVRDFKAAVKADKISRQLADYYTAAAYGDYDDFGYWEETAKQFK